jgi:hypothetical protein
LAPGIAVVRDRAEALTRLEELPPTLVPPPPVLRLFKALAISAANAYLMGITSETKFDSTTTSMRSIISSMRFTFSVKSRRMRMLLLSMASTEFGILAKGCRAGMTSLACTYFS